MAKFQKATNYVISNKTWTQKDSFLNNADIWLVATAATDPDNITIVTNERPDISCYATPQKFPQLPVILDATVWDIGHF